MSTPHTKCKKRRLDKRAANEKAAPVTGRQINQSEIYLHKESAIPLSTIAWTDIPAHIFCIPRHILHNDHL